MASWKKVVVQAANISDAALTVTSASVDMAADSVVIVDATDSKLKSDSVANLASGLAGTDTATGLTASNGVLSLDSGLGNITTLTPGSDKIIVFDADGGDGGTGAFGTALVSSIGNAGTDTNTTYSLSSSVNTGTNEASLVLTDSNTPATTDTIKFSGMDDITLTQSGGAGSEDVLISLDSALTGVTSISNTNLTLESANLILKRDNDNEINFATDNIIKVKTDGSNRVEFTSTTVQPTTNDQIDLGTSSKEFKDAHFSGTVNGTFSGNVTGNLTGLADKATAVITTASSDNSDHFFTFVNDSTTQDSAAGGSNLEVVSSVKLNPSTGIVTATGFSGPLTGDVTGTATNATDAANATGVTINASNHNASHNLVFTTADSGDNSALRVASGSTSSLTYNPNTETLSVTNIEVSGTEIKVNTENLTVTDKLIEIAVGSSTAANASGSGLLVEIAAVAPDATANEGAGNDADVNAAVAKMPELKWSDGGQLTGWTISDYLGTGPNTDFGIAVNHVNSGAPGSGSNGAAAAAQAGVGAFYTDTSGNDLYVYL